MAPISPGRMSEPLRKPKKPVETTKAHRFEGFGKRIAKIKIDPVHTVQKSRLAEDVDGLANSFFRTALDEWAELNLSATFSSFLHKAQPLSESLPQLLHHSDTISFLLHDHIAKQDVLALEPLLSLVAHFAHDLGPAFEKHFVPMTRLVAQVSASVEDPAAIEQSFTCLAWMFKYLSRLLVRDLRPVLKIMAPYFSSRKSYVRRFSAESLAFLLRKAAILYPTKTKPLDLATSYLFGQLRETTGPDLESYETALMTLLSESIVGVNAQVHSSATHLLRCILDTIGKQGADIQPGLRVIDGTVVNVIHRTDAVGFQPLLRIITDSSKHHRSNVYQDEVVLRLLFAVTATRKGSRIEDWEAVIEALLSYLQPAEEIAGSDARLQAMLLSISAVSLQYCPMDQLLPFVNRICQAITTRHSSSQFLAFCEMVSEFGRPRFQDLLRPHLQKYMALHWANVESGICYLLEQLHQTNTISSRPGDAGFLTCPRDWEKAVSNRIAQFGKSDIFPESFAKYFQLSDTMNFFKESSVSEFLHPVMEENTKSALERRNSPFDMSLRLNVGWALRAYVRLSRTVPVPSWRDLIARLFRSRPECFQLMPFLECCLEVLTLTEVNKSDIADYGLLETVLCDNMLSDAPELKEKSLQILLELGKIKIDEWLVETCTLLLELVKTPYLPANARQISMLIRRLPKQQEMCGESPTLKKLIPVFALGLLRSYHDQSRKDLCTALGQMAVRGGSEDIIFATATQWLQQPDDLGHSRIMRRTEESHSKLSPFQCSNYLAVEEFSGNSLQRHADAEKNLTDEFHQAHFVRQTTTPTEGRILALQILVEIPEIAERRSRLLSPIFLSIQHSMASQRVSSSKESTSSHTISPDVSDHPWSLHERKAFLELLGKFANPRVLYRSHELYDHLLELLTNGNTDIRRLALLALLKWKDQSLVQYQEPLLRVAEEKNATTELAPLLADDEETSSLKGPERSHVLPVLLRLVFGQLIGRTGIHGSVEAKRRSIIRLLSRMEERDVSMFIDVAMGRLATISFEQQSHLPTDMLDQGFLLQDQQLGFLRMMVSVQDIFQSKFEPHGKKIVDAVLYCTARAYRQANRANTDETTSSSASALVKSIRRTGIQCLTTVFGESKDINWNVYAPTIFQEIVNPRVPNLATEVAQGVSGLLRMFSAWSRSQQLLYLLERNEQLIKTLWEILAVSSTRDDVSMFVLEHILTPLLEHSNGGDIHEDLASKILISNIDILLKSFASLLERQPSKDMLLAATKVVPLLAPLTTTSSAKNEVLQLLVVFLCEPAQRVPPHIKGQMLLAINSLLNIQSIELSPAMKASLYRVVADLFNYFKDQPNRIVLSQLLSTIGQGDGKLQAAVQICQDLNAHSTDSLREIDYERQLGAYAAVKLLPVTGDSSRQWHPILNNLVFFARTMDDLAIRSNAVSCLKHYILTACQGQDLEPRTLVRDTLLMACKKGLRENSELVRADFVTMLGLIIKYLPDASDLDDMKVLLVGDDDEASFFTNILHVQQHRRLRAIRRLLTEVERGHIKPTNITMFFLPLLEKFIYDESDDEAAQGVKGQSIAAVSTLLKWVDWKSFRTIFRQYKSDLDATARSEKNTIRLLSNATDALASAMAVNAEGDEENDMELHLKTTLPAEQIVYTELKSHFIPKLSKFIHHKDEAEISLRIPAARVAVRLIKLLPADEMSFLVIPIVLDISQILRSRAQESRDVARNALADIVSLLGPSSLQFVVKEMRTTLTRGYQLHVLSYTLHTILLQTAKNWGSGDADYCLEDLVSVVMDDVFGTAGQDKENKDYVSSMREVKSSKSQDSMELLAQSASVSHLSKLITPLQILLNGHLTTRQVRQVDELLRRIGVGISHNSGAHSQDVLVFAYELLRQFHQQKQAIPERNMTNREMNQQRFLIQFKSAHESTSSTSSSLQFKIVKFALDLVRSTLSKNVHLLTPHNVHGLLPVIGDAFIEAQEDVRISAFRLLSILMKLPLPEIDVNTKLYVIEAVKVVKGSTSTNEEFPQAAIKLVTAIIRDRQDVEIRDSDIAYLVRRTMPDIEEPDRQGVTFNFIKAIMARKYELPELYELFDKIGVMMVTNQSRNARDMARGVYVHFILEYPQSRNRWTKQLRFLVKNMEYEFKEGRQSVMEAVNLLLQKLSDGTLIESISTFFIPVVLRMANDEDAHCREMAGALLAQLFNKSDRLQLTKLVDPLRRWLEQSGNTPLIKVALQAWAVYFGVVTDGAKSEVSDIRESISRILGNSEIGDSQWELLYQALELVSKLTKLYPDTMLTQNQAGLWVSIRRCLLSHHSWVQTSAASLIAAVFQNCGEHENSMNVPLKCSHGLQFDRSMILNLVRHFVRMLKYNEGNLDLAQKVLQNLRFLGKYVETVNLTCEIQTKKSVKGPSSTASGSESGSDDEDGSELEEAISDPIPAIQYLLHQLTLILRREPKNLTTTGFTPKMSALSLLNNLVPELALRSLPDTMLISVMTPLTHITDPSLQQPRSADPTFTSTYQSYIEFAQNIQEAIQRKVGDARYVQLMTGVSKIIRERRGERKTKRAIERVADPERAEREKKRKKEIKARRKKEVVHIHRQKRRGGLGF